MFRGQRTASGTLIKVIGFVLNPVAGQSSPIDAIEVPLICFIPRIFGINLAGSGARTSIEFGGLASNASRSIVLQTRATDVHQLEVQVSAPYLLREGSAANEFSTIPFTLAMDGQTYQLTNNAVLRIAAPPGQASQLLTVKIGDTSRKLAGAYKAVITIHISSNL